jgi:hypothetical protein
VGALWGEGAAGWAGSAGHSPGPSRRKILAGGIGAGALIALPDVGLGGRSDARAFRSDRAAFRHTFLYGLPDRGSSPGPSLVAAMCPTSRSESLPDPVPVAVKLAAAPVSSPDQATTALATVHTVPEGARVTLTVLDSASAAVVKQGSVTVAGVPGDANILVTPVFAPGSATVALVLGITVPVGRRPMRKADPHTGRAVSGSATSWRSHHALAYFDQRSGAFTGPFHLSGEPSLALSTAAANRSELVLWTAREPQPDDPAATRAGALLSRVSSFPLGSGTPRFSGPAPAPWPGGEPVVTLPNGDVARLVNGRDVHVCSARTGEVTAVAVEPLSRIRAKPSAVTMQVCPDGTVFMAKPGIGAAVVADPADSFRVKAHVRFPVPASPLGAPWSKAVLSGPGDTLYVLGSARSGGLCAYHVASGALTASYSEGRHYCGLYQLPSGTLLAVAPDNPRLAFFSSALRPLGTADTSLHVSAVFLARPHHHADPVPIRRDCRPWRDMTPQGRYRAPTRQHATNSVRTRPSGSGTSPRRRPLTYSTTMRSRKAGEPGTAAAHSWAAFPRPGSPG